MATLGSAMPAALVRLRIEQQLAPGAVIKFNVAFDDGSSKEKRLVVLSVDANTICCVINTQVNPILSQNPATNRAQVLMPVASHTFMHHDSFVNCAEVRRFSTANVIQELVGKTEWMLGRIDGALRDEIVGVLQTSSTIPPQETLPLIAALKTMP